MKISKKPIQSADTVLDTVDTCKYSESIEYIKNAIQALANIAKDDEMAKDAIANLSVILFDLKG